MAKTEDKNKKSETKMTIHEAISLAIAKKKEKDMELKNAKAKEL